MRRNGCNRTLKVSGYVGFLTVGLYLVAGLACSSTSEETGADADPLKGGEAARVTADLVAQVNEVLQLRSSSVVTLEVANTPGSLLITETPIGGQLHTPALAPQSVRAAAPWNR